jgi:hypothetical protein
VTSKTGAATVLCFNADSIKFKPGFTLHPGEFRGSIISVSYLLTMSQKNLVFML